MWTPGDSVDDVGYAPEQPIPFSHKLHAGQKQIPCEYCHSSARRSTSAGVPSLSTCMGCHRVVKPQSPLIQKITEHFEKNEPMEWVKVHDLPDFVRFSHMPHVKGAGLACQECHGPVETMDKVSMEAPLQMGWCISCHIKHQVHAEHQSSGSPTNASGHPKQKKPPTDCQTCHF